MKNIFLLIVLTTHSFTLAMEKEKTAIASVSSEGAGSSQPPLESQMAQLLTSGRPLAHLLESNDFLVSVLEAMDQKSSAQRTFELLFTMPLSLDFTPEQFGADIKRLGVEEYIQALRNFAQVLYYYYSWYQTMSVENSVDNELFRNDGAINIARRIQAHVSVTQPIQYNYQMTPEESSLMRELLDCQLSEKDHPLLFKTSEGFRLFATTPEGTSFLLKHRGWFLQKEKFDELSRRGIKLVWASNKTSGNVDLVYFSKFLALRLSRELLAEQALLAQRAFASIKFLRTKHVLSENIIKLLATLDTLMQPSSDQLMLAEQFQSVVSISALYTAVSRKLKTLLLHNSKDQKFRQYRSVAKEIDETTPLLPIELEDKKETSVDSSEKKPEGKPMSGAQSTGRKKKKKAPQEAMREKAFASDEKPSALLAEEKPPIATPNNNLAESSYVDGLLIEANDENIVIIDDICNQMRLFLYPTASENRPQIEKIVYRQNVLDWFLDTRTALKEQDYLNPVSRKFAHSEQELNEVIRIHRFSKLVDRFVNKIGVCSTVESRIFKGAQDTCVVIPGHIEYHSSTKKSSCYFVYLIGSDGKCYHRNIHFTLNARMIFDFMSKGFFEVEFPPLEWAKQ